MPRKMEEDGIAITNNANHSKKKNSSSGVCNDFGYHSNGLDVGGANRNGSSPNGNDQKRVERGFETFVMTGDMIIRKTTPQTRSPLEKQNKGKKYLDSEENHSPPVSATKKSNVASRIPKPVSHGTAREIQEPSPSPKHSVQSSDTRVPPPHEFMEIEEKFDSILTQDDDRGSRPKQAPIVYPEYTLDIPPDDISSEDDIYNKGVCLVDLDDLPPPPDELLQDFSSDNKSEELVSLNTPIKQVSSDPGQGQNTSSHNKNSDSAVTQDNVSMETDQSQDSSSPSRSIVVSKSAEKIVYGQKPSGSSSTSAGPIGVRTSKSHENYLECNADNLQLVDIDIDFEDNIASSVDALHYEKSTSSLETSGKYKFQEPHLSKSLENSPEKRHEKHHGPTFIGTDGPKSNTKLKEGLASPTHDSHLKKLEIKEMPNEERMAEMSSKQEMNFDTSSQEDQGMSTNETSPELESPQSSGDHLDQVLESHAVAHETRVIEESHSRSPSHKQYMQYTLNDIQVNPVSHGELNSNQNESSTDYFTEDSPPIENYDSEPFSPGAHGASTQPECVGACGEEPVVLERRGSKPRGAPSSPENGESDSESVYHQPIKEVDRPSAARLAKRLYNMEGFSKRDISRHLSKKNDFAQLVGEEYLKHFDFNGDTLDLALRKFLKQLALAGETQERERVLLHFSKRYMECNENQFNSDDACHTLTCAIMLLNTDLHGQNIGRKMTCAEFVENLADLNDGQNFPKEILKNLYTAIKQEPLECEFDDDPEEFEGGAGGRAPAAVAPPPAAFVGHNPFLDVPDLSKATEYKKGFVMRKCCVDPDGRRTPMGKRGWKMFYATLQDMVLYLHKDEHGFKKNQIYDSLNNAVRIHHSLATKATDYTKKQHVFRLQTSDGASYLFQTGDSKELQAWIETINFVSASLSAPPLPGGVGSQKKFQRPLMPSSCTKLNLREQLAQHEKRATELEQELHNHKEYPPEKGAKSRIIHDYMEKESFLQFELKRFKTYCSLLQSKMSTYPELEPSLVEVAIGEVEEPPSSPQIGGDRKKPGSPKSSPERRAAKPVQRSMSDRYSYRAAIYKNDVEYDVY